MPENSAELECRCAYADIVHIDCEALKREKELLAEIASLKREQDAYRQIAIDTEIDAYQTSSYDAGMCVESVDAEAKEQIKEAKRIAEGKNG